MSQNFPSSEIFSYVVTLEGMVDSSKFLELVEFLSRISTEQTASYQIAEQELLDKPIYESDVVRLDDPVILRRSWHRLITIAVKGENFPLKDIYDDNMKFLYLQGDVVAAIEWLQGDEQREQFNRGPIALLNRYLDSEVDTTTSSPTITEV